MNLPWRIELLGGLRARQGERVIARFASQKSGVLLAYLAYHQRRAHPREELAELLWPESPPEVGRHNLRQALLSLRRQLESPGAAEMDAGVIVAHRAHVQMSPAVTTDVAEFEAGLKAAAQAEGTTRAERLARVVELYQGPMLPGYYEEWLLSERERLAEACLDALRQLSRLFQEAGDLERAVQYGRRAIAMDALSEDAHLDLMRLLIAADRPADALRQFQELERILREQLGDAPSEEATALARQLSGAGGLPAASRRAAPSRPSAATPHAGPATASPPPTVAPLTPRLPVPVTRFFGREAELERVDALLREPGTRLITLTGPGGSGKTRLAIEAARRAAGAFTGAVWFVPLVERADPRAIPDAIAEGLQLQSAGPAAPLDRIAAFLNRDGGEAPSLLVLDNFEHLIEEGAVVVAELIDRVPALICLLTSRQRLELEGEHELPVAPLPVPGAQVFGVRSSDSGGSEAPSTEDRTPNTEHLNALIEFPSVQLFLDRARATRPDFALTPRNAAAVAKLCERLEGLPLALELAAARAQMLTPSQMLMQLEARFDFLVSRRRDIPPRHRTLRAAFGWSYELLPPDLRSFFARLSVFHGRWTLAAAEAVCGDCGFRISDFGSGTKALEPEGPSLSDDPQSAIRNPQSEVRNCLDFLTELRERSLILVIDAEEEMGYRMLETLREYADERLEPVERAVLRERHAEHYLGLAEIAVEQKHLHGPEQSTWLDRLEADHDNFRAALSWSLESGDRSSVFGARSSVEAGPNSEQQIPDTERRPPEHRNTQPLEIGLRLAGLLHFFWYVRGHVSEGRRWLGELLALESSEAQKAASAAERGGRETSGSGDASRSPRALRFRAGALYGAAGLASTQGDMQVACSLYEECLAIYRGLGERGAIADTLCQWGYAADRMGDRDRARILFAESLEIYRELNDRGGTAHVLKCIGADALAQGDAERARALFEESLALYRELGNQRGMAMILGEMSHLALSRADDERAAALVQEHLELARRLNDRSHTALALKNLGLVDRHRGDHAAARARFEESLALRRELGERTDTAEMLAYLSSTACLQNDREAARRWMAECLALLREVDTRQVTAACLELLVESVVVCEEERAPDPSAAGRAARLLAAAERFRAPFDDTLLWPAERAARNACLAVVRAVLGEEAFMVAWAEGSALSREQATHEAAQIEL